MKMPKLQKQFDQFDAALFLFVFEVEFPFLLKLLNEIIHNLISFDIFMIIFSSIYVANLTISFLNILFELVFGIVIGDIG